MVVVRLVCGCGAGDIVGFVTGDKTVSSDEVAFLKTVASGRRDERPKDIEGHLFFASLDR